jgi:hypothetical protein
MPHAAADLCVHPVVDKQHANAVPAAKSESSASGRHCSAAPRTGGQAPCRVTWRVVPAQIHDPDAGCLIETSSGLVGYHGRPHISIQSWLIDNLLPVSVRIIAGVCGIHSV